MLRHMQNLYIKRSMMSQKKSEKVSVIPADCGGTCQFFLVFLTLSCSVLREQEKNWPCYECNRRFVSSEQLQQHLNMHDDKINSVSK